MKCLFLILLFVTTIVRGQVQIQTEELFTKTLCLEKAGTGFVINYNNDFILVTAAHVFKELSMSTRILYRTDGNDQMAKSFFLKDFYPKSSDNYFLEHDKADVFLMKLYPKKKSDSLFLKMVSLPFDIINPKLTPISRDIDVTVFGYPLYDTIQFEPITFKTKFVSGILRLPRFDTKDQSYFYLLQDPGMGGFSGGPVFIGVQSTGMMFGPNKTWLVGIVHGTTGDKTGGKYAAITPSAYIVDLITTFYKK